MKKIVSLILVMIMVLSVSAVAFAASPTGGTAVGGGAKPIEVKEPSAEGKAALEAGAAEALKDQLAEGETVEIVATFSCEEGGQIEANAAGVKEGDKVFVLFTGKDGKIQVIKATVKDGKVIFAAPGAGDFAIVTVNAGEATVPSTGDSNRLMKLVLIGVAAISVMALAGVAIKRTNI